MKKNNVLRDLINEGKPTIGTHVHTVWPGIAEVIGYSGPIDYVEFTSQYAPYDLFALDNFARAIELFDHMTSMIKVDQEPRTYLAEKATGSGIQNLLFADIRTVDDALESVRAVRPETPSAGGIAGATSTRDMGYVFPNVSLADWVKAAEEAVVAIMVEKREAVEDLEAILDVPGIDMVQFGPGDYSMSIGRAGDYTHPEVMEAQKYTIETCIAKGIRPRIEIGNWQDAKPYMDMGVIDFCIGTDVNVIYDYMQHQGGELAKALGRTANGEQERQVTENLEAEFHEAMMETYRRAAEHGYRAAYFLQMVNSHDGVGAAKRLLATRDRQSGLTKLWELGLLSISAEALVLQERFQPLFTDDERRTACERLKDYGYDAEVGEK